MEKSRKIIEIVFPDGSTHKVLLLGCDTTRFKERVLTYYDLDNDMRSGFTEILEIDGKYYNNPDTQKWEYYVRRFETYNPEKSDSFIDELPDKIELYTRKENNKSNKKEVSTVQEKKSKYITAIMYANRGESLVVKDGDSLPPVFFTLESSNSDVEIYKRINISKKDKEEILKDMDNVFRGIIDVSLIPPDLLFTPSSGNKYYITFASCDDKDLFNEIVLCDEIKVEGSLNNIQSGLYPDNLSSALHNELPIEIEKNGIVKRLEVKEEGPIGKK